MSVIPLQPENSFNINEHGKAEKTVSFVNFILSLSSASHPQPSELHVLSLLVHLLVIFQRQYCPRIFFNAILLLAYSDSVDGTEAAYEVFVLQFKLKEARGLMLNMFLIRRRV